MALLWGGHMEKMLRNSVNLYKLFKYFFLELSSKIEFLKLKI